jgi:uncharacterized protein (TIGR02271 family)
LDGEGHGGRDAEEGSAERRHSDGGGVEDELRVQRSEEELRAETREREAGHVNFRKNVRTEREKQSVPKKRHEVEIERVPIGREAEGEGLGEDGDEEYVIQVYEEEIVVSKRLVLKEEIRIKKTVVEETEVVEADLRKEEVEIVDEVNNEEGN